MLDHHHHIGTRFFHDGGEVCDLSQQLVPDGNRVAGRRVVVEVTDDFEGARTDWTEVGDRLPDGAGSHHEDANRHARQGPGPEPGRPPGQEANRHDEPDLDEGQATEPKAWQGIASGRDKRRRGGLADQQSGHHLATAEG